MRDVSVRKRGKTYQYRFEKESINGKRKWGEKQGFATQKEAYLAGLKAQEIYNSGGDTFTPKKISYSDYLNEWLEYVKPHLKYTTINTYSTIIKLYIEPQLGSFSIASLNRRKLKNFLNDLVREQSLAKSYCISILKVLKLTFKTALDLDYIGVDPTINLKFPDSAKFRETPEKHLYSKSDVERIEERFKENKPFLIAFSLARFTGMRTGEIFALTWEDIDFKNNYISVKHNIHDQKSDKKGRWYIGSPKTKNSIRMIPLNPTLKKRLLEYKKEQNEYKKLLGDIYVYYHIEENNDNDKCKGSRIVKNEDSSENKINLICTKLDGTFVGTDLLKYPYKIIHKELGIDCRFYDNRSTLATTLYRANHNNLDTIKDILGHNNERTTLEYYIPTSERFNYNRMNEIINSLDMLFRNA